MGCRTLGGPARQSTSLGKIEKIGMNGTEILRYEQDRPAGRPTSGVLCCDGNMDSSGTPVEVDSQSTKALRTPADKVPDKHCSIE